MGFFEFESELLESARPVTQRPSPTGGPQGRTSGAGGTATLRSSSSNGRAGPSGGSRAAASGRSQQPGAAAASRAGTRGFSLGRLLPYVGQGFDLVRQGRTQIAQQVGAFPRASAETPAVAGQPAGDDGQAPVGQPAPQVDQLGILLQALRQRQIPPLPGQPAPAVTPAVPAVPQPDGMALLRLILQNPRFQRVLQQSAATGGAGPRAVELPVPATSPPRRMRSIPIPLGAVMNAIATLAGQTMTELNASTQEDDPEVPSYLVDEDGEFIVDPAMPQDRAALVAHLFRVSDTAERSGRFSPSDGSLPEAADELDESDAWAREAGFTV